MIEKTPPQKHIFFGTIFFDVMLKKISLKVWTFIVSTWNFTHVWFSHQTLTFVDSFNSMCCVPTFIHESAILDLLIRTESLKNRTPHHTPQTPVKFFTDFIPPPLSGEGAYRQANSMNVTWYTSYSDDWTNVQTSEAELRTNGPSSRDSCCCSAKKEGSWLAASRHRRAESPHSVIKLQQWQRNSIGSNKEPKNLKIQMKSSFENGTGREFKFNSRPCDHGAESSSGFEEFWYREQ